MLDFAIFYLWDKGLSPSNLDGYELEKWFFSLPNLIGCVIIL